MTKLFPKTLSLTLTRCIPAACRMLVLLCTFIVVLTPRLFAIEKFTIDIDRDTSLLPYKFVSRYNNPDVVNRVPLSRRGAVLKPYVEPSDSGTIILLRNGTNTEAGPAVISKNKLPSLYGTDKSPFLTITNWSTYRDSLLQRELLCGCGHWKDSVWAFRFDPATDSLKKILLLAVDAPGIVPGYSSSPTLHEVSDYDFDGMHEMIVYFNAGAKRLPRELFAIKLETMERQWALPMASELVDDCVFDCRDSINPAIILATNPSGQGMKDSEFSDLYGYIIKIDRYGQILLKQIVAAYPYRTYFQQSSKSGEFLLLHKIKANDSDTLTEYVSNQDYLSVIDGNGAVLQSTPIEDHVAGVWQMPYRAIPTATYLLLQDDIIRVYDDSLRLVAISNQLDKVRAVNGFLGRLRLPDRPDEVFVFSGGVYSGDLERLMVFPFPIANYELAGIDSNGFASEFLLSSMEGYCIGKIERRSTWELMTIIYVDYQKYILVAVTALLVTLMLTNFYRSRTKRDLLMITQQKQEIERSHFEITEKNRALEKAYRDLESATEEIALQRARQAAAEQYRTASGQFRHEINNALGAVKIFVSNVVHGTAGGGHRLQFEKRHKELVQSLERMFSDQKDIDPSLRLRLLAQISELDTLDKKLMNSMDDVVLRGIERGLGLAERLRKYERIDHDDIRIPVSLSAIIDDIAAPSQHLLADSGIAFVNSVTPDSVVSGSPELFAILFRNLLDNSIDALRAKTEGSRQIAVSTAAVDGKSVSVCWSDTGIGIPAENYLKIFEPFYTEKPTNGSGLGLSMVRTIVEKYNGRISVESTPGQNTTFSLVFRKN